MNAKSFAPMLVAAMAWTVSAAPPEPTTTTPLRVSAPPPAVAMLVNCDQANWPTRKQIAHDVGINVFDPPNHVRKRAVIEGLRACRRGATDVRLVFVAPQHEQTRELAQIATTP
jgi:hypothetical protein